MWLPSLPVKAVRHAVPACSPARNQSIPPKPVQTAETVHVCYDICAAQQAPLGATFSPLPFSLHLKTVPCRLKHSVAQQSTIWPQLAVATALEASGTSTVGDPPSPTAFNVLCEPGRAGPRSSSNLRTTLPGESPLDSFPTRRGSQGEGGGWVEGVGLRPGWQSNGYTSDAALM